ncbi:MAG: nitrous oxide reductase accessory protein NosL [Amphritea sp.]
MSFSKQADAEAFAESEGGRVLTFDQITLDVLISMNSMQTHSAGAGATPGMAE